MVHTLSYQHLIEIDFIETFKLLDAVNYLGTSVRVTAQVPDFMPEPDAYDPEVFDEHVAYSWDACQQEWDDILYL